MNYMTSNEAHFEYGISKNLLKLWNYENKVHSKIIDDIVMYSENDIIAMKSFSVNHVKDIVEFQNEKEKNGDNIAYIDFTGQNNVIHVDFLSKKVLK